MRCDACGRECRRITVDFGIGAYEYWGAPGFDVQLAEVSDCCEADCVDDGPDDRPRCMLPDCDRVVEYPEFTQLCSEHELPGPDDQVESGVSIAWTPEPTK